MSFILSSAPSVEIHYCGNDMAFIFRYDNKNYSLTVETNKLKVNAITQYIHIDMFSKAEDFFFFVHVVYSLFYSGKHPPIFLFSPVVEAFW